MDKHDTPTWDQMQAALQASNAALHDTMQGMAALMAALRKREAGHREQIEQHLQMLHAAVAAADHKVNRVINDALPRLTRLSEQALEPAATRFDQRLAATDLALEQASNRFAQAQHALERAAMRRLWMATLAMLAAAGMAVLGAGYAVHGADKTLDEAALRRAEIAWLDRIAGADLVPCGEDRLCARIDEKAARLGQQKQYRVIAVRQP